MTENNIFYQRLKEQVKISKKSINQIEKELGYPRNALHNYKHASPSGVRLIELAQYFEINPEYLMGNMFTFGNESIKSFFSQLNTYQKLEMNLLCQEWTNSQLKKLK